jgi:prepilin-type N-terminal cleavage/methylation domain-containing protein
MKDERKNGLTSRSSFAFLLSTCHSRRGFTLMELLLVIVITLILSAISIPMFVNSFEGNQLKVAARSVSRMHRYARSMSVLRGTPAIFEYNPTNQQLRVSLSTNDTALVARSIPEQITFSDFTFLPDDSVDAFPTLTYTDGQCADYALTLTDDKQNEIRLTVDGIGGSVKIEDQ